MKSHFTRCVALIFFICLLLRCYRAAAAEAPPGFTSLCNNRDLTGWWERKPRIRESILALSPEEFQKKHDKSLEDIQRHWRLKMTS